MSPMKHLVMSLTLTLAAVFAAAPAQAELAVNEPAFCELSTFLSAEVDSTTPGLIRSRAFQIGDLILAGMAVGNSQVEATQALANKFSQYEAAEKNCTWYYNDGNKAATQAFHHYYLSKPSRGTAKKNADAFEAKLADVFANNPVSFLSCAVRHGYIGMGCDGQKHRGPSAFAMLLSYVGCSPKNAVAIVNKVWGSNGVPTETREAIAQRGQALGDQNPEMRKALLATMGVAAAR